MTATLEVLGCNAGAPDATSGASGYLVSDDPGSLLIDCGPGTVARLAAGGHLDRLIGVIATHVHADHFLDLMALAYRRRFPQPAERIPLWIPGQSLSFVDAFDDLFGIPTLPDLRRPLHQAFDIRPLDLGSAQEINVQDGLSFSVRPAQHAVPSASVRVRTPDGVVAFSSDTGWCDGMLDAAADADIFVCEATYLSATPEELVGHGHLTADMAGLAATRAGVRQLMVTHLSTASNTEHAHQDAVGSFDGEVVMAAAGLSVALRTGAVTAA